MYKAIPICSQYANVCDIYKYIYIYRYMYIQTNMCKYIYIYIYMYIHMNIYRERASESDLLVLAALKLQEFEGSILIPAPAQGCTDDCR